ncbi:BCCT family transporter [Desulfonatronospira sp. MSAO_Bac3]|uniref:BCCT family transporter n=1 Tax=Desulfonatronospira sp. MSAO_Bac3 TaxID=2293857 RepID=UPI000FED4D1C|nr:BCCT family transporter [Desulfonatronospira sp. MSAO_Bac3]RQD77796.1 MAG: BCCT family transporter [Desulfonatronospira sp. MSAO_Bac3]
MAFQKESGIFKGMNARLTVISTAIILAALVYGAFYTEILSDNLSAARDFLNPFLEWYYVILVAFLLFFMVWLGIGHYKDVRLGHDDERPEFSFVSWVAMLFAAGMGVGIIFWSVAQPVLQFHDNPFVEEGGTPEAAIAALRLTFFHWGLNGWAIFAFVGLVLAYFSFRRDLPLTIRSALYPILGERIRGVSGDVVDTLAVFGTVFGIVTTLGLGVQQLNSGLGAVFDLEATLFLQLVITACIMGIAAVTVVSGLNRGVRWMSELNLGLSVAAMAFLMLWGPTNHLIAMTVEAAGYYAQNLLVMNLYTHAALEDGWQAEWTVFYWGWWLAWAPFVGMFIARISRGRTFSEFIMGVLLVPTVVTMVWMGLFGGSALYQELFGSGGIIDAVEEDVAVALFAMLQGLDLGLVGIAASIGMLLLIATFLITSANAGTLVVNTILSGGDPEPPRIHRVFWAVVLALLTAILLAAGGLEVLQSAVIMGALPFSLVVVAMTAGLLRALEDEKCAHRRGKRTETPREPWADLDDAGIRPIRALPEKIRDSCRTRGQQPEYWRNNHE